MEVMLRKSLVLKIKKTQTNKTLMASNHKPRRQLFYNRSGSYKFMLYRLSFFGVTVSMKMSITFKNTLNQTPFFFQTFL